MKPSNLPAPLVRGAMTVAPPFVLARAIDALLRKMERQHPRLFKNLARLKPTVIHVEPSDLPHRFALKFGGDERAFVRLLDPRDETPGDACIKGNIDVLLNLLQGRIDGDALFFTRGLVIAGDTAAVVALRNTLDREEIDLFADVTSMFGPLQKPAERALTTLGRVREAARHRAAEFIDSLREEKAVDASAPAWANERDALKAEIKTLQTRIAKLEVREKLAKGASQDVAHS